MGTKSDTRPNVPAIDAAAAVDMLVTFGLCLIGLSVLMVAQGHGLAVGWAAQSAAVVGAVCLVGALIIKVMGVKR